jgi:hypothetical protein
MPAKHLGFHNFLKLGIREIEENEYGVHVARCSSKDRTKIYLLLLQLKIGSDIYSRKAAYLVI